MTLSAASFPPMISTMKNKPSTRIFKTIFILLFWILVWWLFALIVNDTYLLPSPADTLSALFKLMSQGHFYKVVFFTFLRVVAGLVSGISFGVALAFLCHRFDFLRSLFAPLITVLKAMPVATFILLLWITRMRGSLLTIFIGFVMVMPIIFQNSLSGLDSIDRHLIEVTEIFEFGFIKKMKILVFPSLRSYLFPAIITTVGLAFKSQIAAEVIAYTNNSIGQYISDATFGLNTEVAFAWIVVIIIFSIGIEWLCRSLLRRGKR